MAVKFTVAGCTEVVFHIARTVHVLWLERAALEFIENRAVWLGHHIGQHRQTTPVGHPDNDFLQPKVTATLDDLLHRRDQAFATIQTKPFGAHVLHMEEFLKTLSLNHFVKDRLPAFAGKRNLFAQALDPLLQPAGLFGVRDMHVLKRKRPTIGPLHDRHDLAHCGDLQPQNLVDENRAVHVGFGKAIGLGIQLWVGGLVPHPQRVKVSNKVTPNTIGTNDHQRADRVQHSAFDLLVRDLNTGRGGLCLDLVTSTFDLRGRGPFTGQCGGPIVGGLRRPVGARPAWALSLALNRDLIVPHRPEKRLPRFVHCRRIVGVPRVHLFQIFRVVALHKARGVELVVGGVFGHWDTSFGLGP